MANGSTHTQHRKEVTPHMHTPATTNPQDRHVPWKTAPTPTLGESTRPAHSRSASAADPAPAPAPARPWTPDGPARRTDSTPTTTASTVAVGAQARQPRQPRPRQHTPTPTTPAPVAASLNPAPSRLGSGREPLETAASPSLPPAARPKTSPAPASGPGQSPTFRRCRLQPNRKPAPSQPPRAISHRFVADRLQPHRKRPGPGQTPADNLHRFVAAGLKPIRRPARPRPDALG